MKVLLDTNGYTALMSGDEKITAILEKADEVCIPAVVLGELYAGFQLGKYLARNLHELEQFLSKPGVRCIEIGKTIAERYGILVIDLKKKGTPIPTNDIWIAAVVLETGSRLLSKDSHFTKIPGIALVSF
jgi:tRNA(fMet)-specific endonuclease VapC